MPQPVCAAEDFAAMFREFGAEGTAARLGISTRSVFSRRRRVERELGITLAVPGSTPSSHPERHHTSVEHGIVLVFGDCHYWPGEPPTAHRALVQFLKTYGHRVKIIIANGDIFDGARISRHPSTQWEQLPSVKQELEAVDERLHEIDLACPHAEKIWNVGNHDTRLESYLVQRAPEMMGVDGMTLKERFPRWTPAVSTWINDAVVVKHRYKGGVHAPGNNTKDAGKSVITGHMHSQKVYPWTDYNGCRWGVDAGCIAEPFGPQFTYNEDNPRNQRAGFAVLTFHDWELLDPELVRVNRPGEVVFRGKRWSV